MYNSGALAMNKFGQITPKMIASFREKVDTHCKMADLLQYRFIMWNTIKTAVSKGWQMCECWQGHEDRCRYEPFPDWYTFVTFTKANFSLYIDIDDGLFEIELDNGTNSVERRNISTNDVNEFNDYVTLLLNTY